ncbi:MAG TPA: hypothetical protein VFU89_03630 [Rhabdochlamydiaceae bacterium]|nr:hypothetical protein [Rhabdochlamydiaceae bacterium]
MDVTSATETFTERAELFDQDKYKSMVEISLRHDPIQMENNFQRPLSQRITLLSSPTKSIYEKYQLDDVVITCPAKVFRTYQQQQWGGVKEEWNGLGKKAADKSWYGVTAALTAMATAVVGGVLTAMDEAVPIAKVVKSLAGAWFAPTLLIAGLVAAVAAIIFVAMKNGAINEANEQIDKANQQINKWGDDPVMKIGHARDYAYNQGFPHIYRNNLKLGQGPSKTGLFHPLLVEYAYKKYFNSFCSDLIGELNPAKRVNQFRDYDYNPISVGQMTYGLEHIPEYMLPVIEDCKRLLSWLKDIASSYDRLMSNVRTTTREQIAAYTTTKHELLQPIAKRRDHGIAVAEKERTKVTSKLESTLQQRQDAEKVFDAVKEACDATYEKEASPIIKKYNSKIKDAEKELATTLKRLEEQKSNQLISNDHAVRELVVHAKEAWDNKHYRPINFQHYFPGQPNPAGQPVWTQQQPGYYQQPAVYQQQPATPQQPARHVAPPPPPPPTTPPSPKYSYGYPAHAPIPHGQYFGYTTRS